MKSSTSIAVGLLALSVLGVGCSPNVPNPGATSSAPTNVIFMIGDGMGAEQVKAAGLFLNGEEGTLSFESWPYTAEVTTYAANSEVTDSAASATAMATGHKVNNGVISEAIPRRRRSFGDHVSSDSPRWDEAPAW